VLPVIKRNSIFAVLCPAVLRATTAWRIMMKKKKPAGKEDRVLSGREHPPCLKLSRNCWEQTGNWAFWSKGGPHSLNEVVRNHSRGRVAGRKIRPGEIPWRLWIQNRNAIQGPEAVDCRTEGAGGTPRQKTGMALRAQAIWEEKPLRWFRRKKEKEKVED